MQGHQVLNSLIHQFNREVEKVAPASMPTSCSNSRATSILDNEQKRKKAANIVGKSLAYKPKILEKLEEPESDRYYNGMAVFYQD